MRHRPSYLPRKYNFLPVFPARCICGGIYCYNKSAPNVINCLIYMNSAQANGGGINCNHFCKPVITNCTIADNTAELDGGGLFCYAQSSPTLTNCILWGDSPEEIFVESGDLIVTYSDIQGGWEGEGNIDIDPLFTDPTKEDFNLQSDSPCIDAGDPLSAIPLWGGACIDMGACEYDQGWYVNEDGLIVRKPVTWSLGGIAR